jgi:hypothetical protein
MTILRGREYCYHPHKVDVIETSPMTAVSDRDDYCVCDMLEFLVGGTYLVGNARVLHATPIYYLQAPLPGKLR